MLLFSDVALLSMSSLGFQFLVNFLKLITQEQQTIHSKNKQISDSWQLIISKFTFQKIPSIDHCWI